MDDRGNVPYLAQDPTEVGKVIRAMNEASKGGKSGKSSAGFHVKKKKYDISDESGRTVESWQMNDWDYKKPNLPTYARGFFTHDSNGKPEIAVRGYDKFFNTGEVDKTQWRNIEQNTRGPYELSVKENGCIIFIAGLDDRTLIVTSKHSTGPRGDPTANHALVGESWIDKQLSTIGKSRADLAKKLREMNATAVAELCDDSFEEHVLEYTPDQAGLYLHGINLNLPEFATYPGKQVAKFAEEWGFRKVMYVMKDDISQVKPFLEEVAETGNYDGRDTEGFVIRCQARDGPDSPWEDWFFKYKFEEPYLMYRQWRECTKAVIAGRLPHFKKHKKITEEYLFYVRRQLAKDRSIGERYKQNHGIIAVRNGFLAEKGLNGSDIIRSELLEGSSNALDVTENVVLVPVATIGCGKTTIALALVKLFSWGHEQNDNIQGKSRPQQFALATTNSLAVKPVIFADRNNHQKREREQIITDVRKVIPEAKFVALHWVHERSNYDDISNAMQERIFARGDNHQTIQAGSKARHEIVGIMDGFMKRFERVNPDSFPDDGFDLIIDLDPTTTSRENLGRVVHRLHDEFPKLFDMPSDEDMDEAISSAMADYKPDIKHDLSGKFGKASGVKGGIANRQSHDRDTNVRARTQENATPPKPRALEYFCISLAPPRINAILDAVFSSADSDTSRFYKQLKVARRIQREFHVTLIHRAAIPQHAKYWNRLNDVWRQKADNGNVDLTKGGSDGGIDLGKPRVHLERIVWDERIMAIVVRLPDANDEGQGGFKSVNEVAHITVGTAGDTIKPKESNDLLARWLKDDVAEGPGGKIRSMMIKGNVVLEGSAKGILSR